MPDLELELDTHTYRLNGSAIPGCTQVLTAVGAAPSFWFLTPEEREYHSSRGHAVDRAVELLIRGTIDKRTVEKRIRPYLIGWERFANDYNVEVVNIGFGIPDVRGADLPAGPFIQVPLCHKVYRYGVKPDIVARVKGNIAPIELKATSAHSPATAIQTSAQEMAVEYAIGEKLSGKRWAVRLLPEEPYFDPVCYTERGDRATWLGMLSTYNWRLRHKLLRKPE